MEIPTWRYKKDCNPKIFDAACEDMEALEADGWEDTPAKFDAVVEIKTTEPVTIVTDSTVPFFREDPSQLTDEELFLLADSLEIKYRSNVSRKSLTKKITEQIGDGDN